MKSLRINIITRAIFFIVALCFIGHEATPHHHHDILKAHNECCHNHDNHKSNDSSCKILNYISSSKVITYNFRIEFVAIIELCFADLSNALNVKFSNQLIRVLEQIPILLKSQYNNSSFSLRAPPVA